MVVSDSVVRNNSGLRFAIEDRDGSASLPVRYTGTVPDPFREGREVIVTGKMDYIAGLRRIGRGDLIDDQRGWRALGILIRQQTADDVPQLLRIGIVDDIVGVHREPRRVIRTVSFVSS
jgi:hypothetical protein